MPAWMLPRSARSDARLASAGPVRTAARIASAAADQQIHSVEDSLFRSFSGDLRSDPSMVRSNARSWPLRISAPSTSRPPSILAPANVATDHAAFLLQAEITANTCPLRYDRESFGGVLCVVEVPPLACGGAFNIALRMRTRPLMEAPPISSRPPIAGVCRGLSVMNRLPPRVASARSKARPLRDFSRHPARSSEPPSWPPMSLISAVARKP
jgi:hypothetical protein